MKSGEVGGRSWWEVGRGNLHWKAWESGVYI